MLYIIVAASGAAAGFVLMYILVLIATRSTRRRRFAEPPKRKTEFSKFILGAYGVFCLVFIQENYILAFMNRTEVNSAVTATLISTLAATVLGYFGKSAGEKHSRNIHHLDESGKPYDKNED